jgi:tape measure domain-containing protein
MADDTKTLAWRLVIETTNIDKNTRAAANSLASMETQAQKLMKGLKGLGIVASAAVMAKLALEALKVADAYTAMANTLRQSTDSAAELQAVQTALIDQAQATSSTVEMATESFNKLHDATEGLGLSQQQVLDLSKTLADTMRLSGMSAEQAQQGIAAFANTLEDGGMSLKEFKQAFKESPELIKALQVGLGKTKDELRLMAEQGELTSEAMLAGLGRAAPEVARRVGEMAPTLKDAFASAKSGFGAMIGEFNEGIGLTESLARSLQASGEFFKDVAGNAQRMGIAVKFALKTVEIEIATFIDLTIENFIRLGIGFNRLLNNLATAGELFGRGFGATIDKQSAESDARLRAIIERKKKFTEDFTAATDAQAAAMNGGSLNTPGNKSPKILTDEQVQVYENFKKTLDGLKTKAGDTADEMETLRIEFEQGKQSADAYRAQLQAAAAGRDFRKTMEDSFAKQKLKLGPEELRQIDAFVESLAKTTTQSKATAEAVALVQSAMSGAMTDTERAAKETEALARAFEQVQKTMKPTEVQFALVARAQEKIAESSRKVQTSFDEAMKQISKNTKQAETDLEALNIQMTEGADAGDAFRASAEASLMRADLEESWAKAFAIAGKTFGDDEREKIRKYVDQLIRAQQALDSTAHAWEVVGEATAMTMTESERAAAQINELNKAMIVLDEKGLLTDDLVKRFDLAFEHIAEKGDLVTETWRSAAQTVVGNFVDFLADGEFNMKRFVQSTIREVGRLIIQMMIMKSLAGTKFGNFIGIKAASGEAFNHGRLVPMASGGIVSSPTIFPMASGQTGLMGEAGPEAVMPLARMSSGKLGVNAQPSNIQVINNTGVQASARIERSQNRTSIILEAAQLGAQMAEERMTRSMRSGYGATAGALQKTYALRRRG